MSGQFRTLAMFLSYSVINNVTRVCLIPYIINLIHKTTIYAQKRPHFQFIQIISNSITEESDSKVLPPTIY